jgi:short-subunit dehydrogenase
LRIDLNNNTIWTAPCNNPGAINTPFFSGEDLARMPPVAKNTLADPHKLVDKIFKTLAKGKHELTYPWFPRSGYWVRALAPEFMRKQTKRVTLGKLQLT